MKFLVDAQLPRLLARQLAADGHDALHTLDLPNANRSSDLEIIERADSEDRVVVTKDVDFVVEHTLNSRPRRLLLIATGNISNLSLETLLRKNLAEVIIALERSSFVELGRDFLTSHGD